MTPELLLVCAVCGGSLAVRRDESGQKSPRADAMQWRLVVEPCRECRRKDERLREAIRILVACGG